LLHTNKNAIISFWKCNFLLLKTRWTYFSIISVLKKLLLEHRIYHSVMTEFLELGPFAYVESAKLKPEKSARLYWLAQSLDPTLRLLNLQLQRQRCGRLDRFFICWRKYFYFQNTLGYSWRCNSRS
jgi:hypothetical protein